MRSLAKVRSAVYLAVREVPRRFMGTRTESKWEAELREIINDKYVTRAHVDRPSRTEALEAIRKLAAKRGWQVDDTKRPSWHTRDAATERMIAEEARDLRPPPAIAHESEAAQILAWLRATFGYRIRKEVYDAIERGDWRKERSR